MISRSNIKDRGARARALIMLRDPHQPLGIGD
jgi:hypothetical protein